MAWKKRLYQLSHCSYYHSDVKRRSWEAAESGDLWSGAPHITDLLTTTSITGITNTNTNTDTNSSTDTNTNTNVTITHLVQRGMRLLDK